MGNDFEIKDFNKIVDQYNGRLSQATKEIIYLNALIEELNTELNELKSKPAIEDK